MLSICVRAYPRFLPRIFLASVMVLAPVGLSAHASTENLSSAQLAATWAAGEFTGDHIQGDFGADPGLTADLVLALAATGVSLQTTKSAADWLAEQAPDYVSAGVPKSVLAGSAAKLALVARAVGANSADFGNLNLQKILLGQLTAEGKFADAMNYSGAAPVDNSTTFTQSLAVLALAEQTPATAVQFLAQTQCADGGYPVFYPTAGQACESDVDGTGIVVQALVAQGESAASAVAWLLKNQGADGSFKNSGPGAAANSNSTALAAQALRAGGEPAAADQASQWLISRQLGCAAPASQRGAIGYLEPVVDGSTLRATAQAIPALAEISLADIAPGKKSSSASCLSQPSPAPSDSASASSPSTSAEPPTTSAEPPPTSGAAVDPTTRPAPQLSPSVLGTSSTAAPSDSAPSTKEEPALSGRQLAPRVPAAAAPQTRTSPPATGSRSSVSPPPVASGSVSSQAIAQRRPWSDPATWGVAVGVLALSLWLIVVLWQRRSGVR